MPYKITILLSDDGCAVRETQRLTKHLVPEGKPSIRRFRCCTFGSTQEVHRSFEPGIVEGSLEAVPGSEVETISLYDPYTLEET